MKILFLAVQAQYLFNPKPHAVLINEALLLAASVAVVLSISRIAFLMRKMRKVSNDFFEHNDTKRYNLEISPINKGLVNAVLGILIVLASVAIAEGVRNFFF